jgi:hypothetical protein
VPELLAMIAASPIPRTTMRHAIADPAMHMHPARAGSGMTFLAALGAERLSGVTAGTGNRA